MNQDTIIRDCTELQNFYGFLNWVSEHKNDPEMMRKFLEFRMSFLTEEYQETMNAYETKNPEEIIDGLIDIVVIAIGTLVLFDIDPSVAWKQVHDANMNKSIGMKDSRPNDLGLPDLIKDPKTWKAPDHSNNHGLLAEVLSND